MIESETEKPRGPCRPGDPGEIRDSHLLESSAQFVQRPL